MHHTDAAGLLFFGHQLALVHDAYETLLEKMGMDYGTSLKKCNYLPPIVHVESDYKKALFVGDKITISVKILHVGNSSFALDYKIHKNKILVGTAKTVHVTIDKKTREKIPLPQNLRATLEKFAK